MAMGEDGTGRVQVALNQPMQRACPCILDDSHWNLFVFCVFFAQVGMPTAVCLSVPEPTGAAGSVDVALSGW